MHYQTKKALSLIEMSVVLIIIGILIAGVIAGQGLIANFKIKAAQKLTLNSPVSSIDDLLLWYETSLNDSLEIDHSNATITKWHDLNPHVGIDDKIDAYHTSQALPTYEKDVINGLPVVAFKDGAKNILIDPNDDSLSFLAGHDYTIFVIEQRLESGQLNGQKGLFLGGVDSDTDYKLQFGYGATNFLAGNQGRQWNVAVTLSDILSPRLHILKFNNSTGKHYQIYSKDISYSEDNDDFINYPLRSYNNPIIGGSDGSTDLGLAEMIIFKRALKNSEIESIRQYLLQKYAM